MKIIDIITRLFFKDVKKDIEKHLDESFEKVMKENKEENDRKLKEFELKVEKMNEKLNCACPKCGVWPTSPRGIRDGGWGGCTLTTCDSCNSTWPLESVEEYLNRISGGTPIQSARKDW